MLQRCIFSIVFLFIFTISALNGQTNRSPNWTQWGMNPQHTGMINITGQSPNRILANVLYDRHVKAEIEETGGLLLVHYQTALVDGESVFMEIKTGEYTGAATRETQIWGQRKYKWDNGKLLKQWDFLSDWKPVPYGGPSWEPVYHAVLAGNYLYSPGAGGTVYKIDREDGKVVTHINPFGDTIDNCIYVAGPLVADRFNNLYYNAIKLDPADPWQSDVVNSWLVKIKPTDKATRVTYKALVLNAPDPNKKCEPTNSLCGSQRPGINIAPAISPDGTIYTISRSHFSDRYAYLVGVNRKGLKPKWAATLRGRLHDGCGVLVSCEPGAKRGSDPDTNKLPAGRVLDISSSSPVVTPDGSVLYGSYTAYNCAQGHTFKFSPSGKYLGSYEFGWDQTPGIYSHDNTYSIVVKENHYCEEAFYITQLSSELKVEWKYQNTNTLSCERKNGKIQCVDDHPNSFEWCVNALGIDKDGTVYANSEDGNVYAIQQGGILKKKLFLKLALGAAYTPMTIGPDGKIYTQNAGRLFVVGQ